MIAARSNLDAALDYAGRGLPVLPCIPHGKQPAIRGGFHAASTNPETIRRLWRLAECNIGIATGPVAGFWVLDVDGAVGEASLAALEQMHGPLPPTRTVISGGGGRHFWFRYNGPIPSTAGRIAPGIDTRGDAAYIIVPPSTHANGRCYAFASFDELADAPGWLERLARTKTVSERALETIKRTGDISPVVRTGNDGCYGRAALDAEIADLAVALPGTRNSALNRCAFRLYQLVAGGELGVHPVEHRLIDACHRNGLIKDDGLASVLATIRSARAGLKFPRSRSGGA